MGEQRRTRSLSALTSPGRRAFRSLGFQPVAISNDMESTIQTEDLEDDLRPEYDEETLRGLLKGRRRGVYAERYAEGTNLVNLDPDTVSDELLPEYRFDYSKAKPNRFASRPMPTKTTVDLDPDVASVFTTPEAVNAVLRALIQTMPKTGRAEATQ